MLPKTHRLAGRREVERVYRKGHRVQGHYLTVRTLPTTGPGRATVVVPVSVSKKATERNRAKRIIRALLAHRSLIGNDFVLSVRRLPEGPDWSGSFKKEIERWFPA